MQKTCRLFSIALLIGSITVTASGDAVASESAPGPLLAGEILHLCHYSHGGRNPATYAMNIRTTFSGDKVKMDVDYLPDSPSREGLQRSYVDDGETRSVMFNPGYRIDLYDSVPWWETWFGGELTGSEVLLFPPQGLGYNYQEIVHMMNLVEFVPSGWRDFWATEVFAIEDEDRTRIYGSNERLHEDVHLADIYWGHGRGAPYSRAVFRNPARRVLFHLIEVINEELVDYGGVLYPRRSIVRRLGGYNVEEADNAISFGLQQFTGNRMMEVGTSPLAGGVRVVSIQELTVQEANLIPADRFAIDLDAFVMVRDRRSGDDQRPE